MEFFDKNGRYIAYTEDDIHIFLFSGEPVGYIIDDMVYAYNGTQLGWYENGQIRDKQGQVVFSTNEAPLIPIRPMPHLRPTKYIKQIAPMKYIRQTRAIRPINSLFWSNLYDDQFFRQLN